MKKFFLIICFIIAGSIMVKAQERPHQREGNGEIPKESSISGTIIDSETNQAVEYASVVVHNTKDSSIITGTITDPKGYFIIEKLSFGKYYIDVDFIGYKKKRINNLFLNPKETDIKLGNITLNKSIHNLSEVEIIGEKTLVEYKIDKKVINVGKDLMSEGGTAVDVLENTPSVETDIDGNVSLRGSSNFTVLIDGKPTLLEGSDALQQIPSSSIESIEIITNPSAKYDPDGTVGIINVILKKQRERGLNGIVNGSVGNFGNLSTDGIFNYRLGKVNFFTGFSYNQRKNPGTMTFYKETYLDADTFITDEDGIRSRNMGGYNFKAGVEYDLTSTNFLSLSGELGNFSFGRNRSANYHDYTLPATIDEYQVTENLFDIDHNNLKINSFYQHKFKKKGHQFEAIVDYSSGLGNDQEDLKEYLSDSNWEIIGDNPDYQQSIEKSDSKNLRAKIDYVNPIGKNGKFESGLQSLLLDKSSDYKLNKMDYDTGLWLNIDSLNNQLDFNRQIHAVYSTFSNVFMNFEFMIGLRLEYTNRIIFQRSIDETYKIDRVDYFPTIHISRPITENQQIMASYSRRIDRPRDWDLDPFPSYMDQRTIRMGNPELEPEYTDSYELNYQHKLKKSSFVSLETYYRQTNNLIERISYVDSNNIMISMPENFSRDFSIGMELMGNIDLYKWMNINVSFDGFNYNIEGEVFNSDISQSTYTWRSRLNITFKLKYGTQFQINASYRAPTIEPQEKEAASISSGAAIRQDFFKRKISVSIRARDIFGSHRHASESFGSNFYSSIDSRGYYPMISFSVSYKINNYKQKKMTGEMDTMDYGGGGEMD